MSKSDDVAFEGGNNLIRRGPKEMGDVMMDWFETAHLGPEVRRVAEPIASMAKVYFAQLGDDPECEIGLRKLLEAKDCFVRAKIRKMRQE